MFNSHVLLQQVVLNICWKRRWMIVFYVELDLANTSLMDSRRMKVWKNKHCCNEGVHKRQTMTHMQQRAGSLVTIDTFHRERKMRKLNQWIIWRKLTAAVYQDTFLEKVAQLVKTDTFPKNIAHTGVQSSWTVSILDLFDELLLLKSSRDGVNTLYASDPEGRTKYWSCEGHYIQGVKFHQKLVFPVKERCPWFSRHYSLVQWAGVCIEVFSVLKQLKLNFLNQSWSLTPLCLCLITYNMKSCSQQGWAPRTVIVVLLTFCTFSVT